MLNKLCLNAKNLLSNFNLIKKHNKNSKICAMVKANAYGHGAKQIVKLLNDRADFFGVSCVWEAKYIKQFTSSKIIIVAPFCHKNFVLDNQFSYTCCGLDDVKFLARLNKSIDIHLKINSGMNRFGFCNRTKFKKALEIIKNSRLNLEGIFTHFATDDKFVKKQCAKFKCFVKLTHQFGFRPIVHADNSAVNLKHNHHLDMMRVGYNLYGAQKPFRQVMSLNARVLQVNHIKAGECAGYSNRFVANKNTKIAVVSLGYADGFGLGLIGMDLFVKNTPCKVVNVCMDCFMLDVTNVNIKKGDKIWVLSKINTLQKFANYQNSTCYQVMCQFGCARADRVLVLPAVATHHKNHKQQPYKRKHTGYKCSHICPCRSV